MRIAMYGNNNKKKFGQLFPGDVFYFPTNNLDITYFIKVLRPSGDPGFDYNAVELEHGYMTHIDPETIVTRYDCILVRDDDNEYDD